MIKTITFNNKGKKSASDIIRFWKMAHPKFATKGLTINNGNITLTYDDGAPDPNEEKKQEEDSNNDEDSRV